MQRKTLWRMALKQTIPNARLVDKLKGARDYFISNALLFIGTNMLNIAEMYAEEAVHSDNLLDFICGERKVVSPVFLK